jgi:lipoprotein-anchoring transpeptidase ErfK/SrfK
MSLFPLLLFLCMTLSAAAEAEYDPDAPPKPLTHELIPLTKTSFLIVSLKNGRERTVDLTGKDFILVSVRETGSDGRFYAVDRDGTVWWSGPVTSGVPQFRSPSGVFPILEKRRYHMSRDYPDESGINNMDFMMKFTKWGHALHKGSVAWMSHGCIHLDPRDVPVIYRWSRCGMPVVVTRHTYMPFAREDLHRIYIGR